MNLLISIYEHVSQPEQKKTIEEEEEEYKV